MKSDYCIDVCNRLLRGERSAVETYDKAIEKYAAEPAATELSRIREEHADATESLEENVRSRADQCCGLRTGFKQNGKLRHAPAKSDAEPHVITPIRKLGGRRMAIRTGPVPRDAMIQVEVWQGRSQLLWVSGWQAVESRIINLKKPHAS